MPGDVFKTLKMDYARQEIARRNRLYNLYELYYLGVQYNSAVVKMAFKLYAAVKEFYSLIPRVVDLDVQLVPGGWLVADPEAMIPVGTVLDESDWELQGGKMVHYGAIFGDIYLRNYGNGFIQPLDPRGIWMEPGRTLIKRDVVDQITGVKTEYAEVITPDTFYFYTDGKLMDQYENPFGFIPVYYGQNKDVGHLQGLNTFHNVLDEINAVNEMATFLGDQIMDAISGTKVVSGAGESELEYGADRTIFLTAVGSKIEQLRADLDIAGALDFIKDLRLEVKAALPELVFDGLKSGNLERPVSADALRLHMQELFAKIKRMRLGYDRVLVKAVNGAFLIRGEPVLDFSFDPNRPILDVTATEKLGGVMNE
jgi:hypothetical protein